MILKKIIRIWLTILKAIIELLGDNFYFLKYMVFIGRKDIDHLQGLILASTHVIEKGLSLPKPRLGYGKPVLNLLFEQLKQYEQNGFSINDFVFQNGVAVIKAYIEFHQKHNFDINEVEEKYEQFSVTSKLTAGTIELSNNDLNRLRQASFDMFSQSRYSLRNFGGDKISGDLLLSAIELAQKAPSSCNRQPQSVFWIKSQSAKNVVLEHQNGARGFGASADSFLIVSLDVKKYNGIRERFLPFIDGGIFISTLMQALHFYGIGCCPLNWAVPNKTDKILKKKLSIKKSEIIVIILAIGSFPKSFKVSKSCRRNKKTMFFEK